jgi:hypothetical protein
VAGNSYTTGDDGIITLSTAAASGATVDATAPGFLPRATTLRASTLTLWQIPAGTDINFVRQLAYLKTGLPEVLWRPAPGVLNLQLIGEIASDPAARSAHIQAAAMASALTGANVRIELGGSATGVFTVLINSANSEAATTFLSQTAGTIQTGRVEYANLAAARSVRVIAHELGHILGFGHAPTGLMCPSGCGADRFSPVEADVFASMLQRTPGTAPLDNDRAVVARSEQSTAIFRCDIR